ncbi:ATP-dependent Clp protease ATP-binding subunit ClpA [Aquicella siphonis]|uniref:ATP-dependent Clp protease ATP-binding subunit ClpA n=1 Tax=Aquicella siphonis TaxID=254247 RepID=A0A5E4PHT3_9COXI|nr:ATP-dependent Clp protease ATP-binding subunit ClpA [Aquicella siphonis]VVC76155.1 ATP-dependent Clp protease ATP-binding subunit ClpA [Aquicella siphonis]
MLDKELEYTLNTAFKEARNKRHEFVTVEHLLLALLDNSSAQEVLKACGANINRLRSNLTEFIDRTTPVIPLNIHDRDTQPTLGFQRVIQRAVFQVQSSGKTEVSGANILAAIFSEQESQSVYFIRQENISRLDVINYIAHGTAKPKTPQTREEHPFNHYSEDSEGMGDENGTSPLELYTTNLNARAKMGLIDPLIGREEEIERTIQVLCRRRKNNPLLVGEAGVGKTAIAEGLARLIVEKQVPAVLFDSIIYSLDLGSLLAGTKYRGDFEKRLKSVLHQLKEQKGAILFIDEIHTIIGAGAASGGLMDVSNLIKPLLASGELTCIGSTTYKEYRSIFEKDHALDRRFQKIDIKEPTIEQSIEILKGLRGRFEAHHNVKYTDESLEAAARLSARYISDRHLPDKAIDLVDEVGAYQYLLPEVNRKKVIEVGDIEKMVAKIARVPERNVSASDREVLKNLTRDLKMMIYGQDESIETLGAAVKLARSGLRDPNKPIGSFLFIGPTGVGKTEVCKQLAKITGVELLRFDMSEYMERHSVSRLIGAPPGYVGYDEGGLLTEAVNKTPHSIVLLDEIEKAHPDVYNLLLQIMDHGTLTDMNGRKTDFRHTILIMTSNAGADVMDKSNIGFTPQDNDSDIMSAVNRVFSPEFRNRLDAVIQFKALDTKTILSVVNKFVAELEGQLESKNVILEVDEEARAWLAKNGYDKKMGARPMARLIQEQLKKPLAEELLFGQLSNGGHVKVTIEKGKIKFLIEDTSDTAMVKVN